VELTSRERVLLTLEHKEVDRPVLDLGGSDCTTITRWAYRALAERLGFEGLEERIWSRRFGSVLVDPDVQRALGVDVRPITWRPSSREVARRIDESSYVDEWGLLYKSDGRYFNIARNPLAAATLADLESYDWPEPEDPARVEGVAQEARWWRENSDYALLGPGVGCTLFEMAWYLRGFERFLMDMASDKEFAHALMRRVLDIRKRQYGRFLQEAAPHLDIVYVADDIAMQSGPLMSPAMYREMVKPYHAEYFAFIKEMSGARLFYHSCGGLFPFLDDLVSIGVDILNPVQVSAKGMDIGLLKSRYGGKLVFWGGLDTQRILPRGTPGEVAEAAGELKRVLWSDRTGFALSAVHNIQDDTPAENVLAMLEAGRGQAGSI
jgi:uroporphyrinogen decarboxylase